MDSAPNRVGREPRPGGGDRAEAPTGGALGGPGHLRARPRDRSRGTLPPGRSAGVWGAVGAGGARGNETAPRTLQIAKGAPGTAGAEPRVRGPAGSGRRGRRRERTPTRASAAGCGLHAGRAQLRESVASRSGHRTPREEVSIAMPAQRAGDRREPRCGRASRAAGRRPDPRGADPSFSRARGRPRTLVPQTFSGGGHRAGTRGGATSPRAAGLSEGQGEWLGGSRTPRTAGRGLLLSPAPATSFTS